MGFDLFQSRREYNEFCKWWSRNESDDFSSDELIMKRIPTGMFLAKEVSSENKQSDIISDSFMFDKTTITIKSPDNLNGLKQHDLILFRGEKWFVVTVQKSKAKIQNTFFANDKNCSHFWYIELRK